MKKDNILRLITLYEFTAFTLLTLFWNSSLIFDWFGIRAMEGIGLANRRHFSMANFELDSDATVSVKIVYE
ncbi:MAG: hypothetical protein WBM53_03180 [Maribacter sp.]